MFSYWPQFYIWWTVSHDKLIFMDCAICTWFYLLYLNLKGIPMEEYVQNAYLLFRNQWIQGKSRLINLCLLLICNSKYLKNAAFQCNYLKIKVLKSNSTEMQGCRWLKSLSFALVEFSCYFWNNKKAYLLIYRHLRLVYLIFLLKELPFEASYLKIVMLCNAFLHTWEDCSESFWQDCMHL